MREPCDEGPRWVSRGSEDTIHLRVSGALWDRAVGRERAVRDRCGPAIACKCTQV
ncbi:hypothetical protein GCM10027294_46990 [Marinactinospora endophytica]